MHVYWTELSACVGEYAWKLLKVRLYQVSRAICTLLVFLLFVREAQLYTCVSPSTSYRLFSPGGRIILRIYIIFWKTDLMVTNIEIHFLPIYAPNAILMHYPETPFT